jgi:C-terminal processing protease CtpA/Prc
VTIGDWPEEQTWGMITPEHMMWLDRGRDFLAASFGRGRLGVNVTDLNEDLASYFDATAGEGVLVTNVIDESTADEMGIKAGDVIVEVGDDAVGSTGDLIDAVQEIDPGNTFDVTVIRKRNTVKLEGTMQESPATAYVKALKAYPHRLQMPHMKLQERYEVPDAEIKALKKEMQEMREEIDKMRQELKKVERRAR